MTPKNISNPDLKSARQLSPLDMNRLHFDPKHTVLTPEQLMKLAQTPADKK